MELGAGRGVGVNIVGSGHAQVGEVVQLAGNDLIPALLGNIPAEPRVSAQTLGHLVGWRGSGRRE